MREATDLLAIRLDDKLGDFTIQRVTSRIELLHTRQRIGCLQQRAVLAVARALPQGRRGGMQVQHGAVLRQ